MRPWQHARSSVGRSGDWRTDLAIHEFLDSTKASCADRRHRLVLHHVDLGVEIARRAFPDRTDVDRVVTRHVTEDLRAACTLQDWFDQCDAAALPAPLRRRMAAGPAGVADMIAARVPGGCRDAVGDVAGFLFRPMDLVPAQPDRALCVLMNAAGLAVTRRVFGPPEERRVDGRAVVIDWGWIAEAVIFTTYGRILDLGEVVRCWPREPGAPADA